MSGDGTVRLVPIVAIVSEDVARRIGEITRVRGETVDDDEAVATLRSLAAQNGWTMEMLVAGAYLGNVVPDGFPVEP